MHVRNKRKWAAAAAAPFVMTVTLTLGAAPAYAGGANGQATAQQQSKKADKSSKSSKSSNSSKSKATAERQSAGQSQAPAKRVKRNGGSGEDRVATPSGRRRASANSAATIAMTGDCVIQSSKDISHIAFFLNGEEVSRDESVGTETFDLSTVSLDFDSFRVKAGTTVVRFANTCAADSAGNHGDVAGGASEGKGDDPAHRSGSNGKGASRSPAKGDNGGAASAATFTMTEDCVIKSSKNITRIAFFLDGDEVARDVSVGTGTFDLSTVSQDFDSVQVKAGTTVERFANTCFADTAGNDDDTDTIGGGGDTRTDGSIVGDIQAQAQSDTPTAGGTAGEGPLLAGVAAVAGTGNDATARQPSGARADASAPSASESAAAQTGFLPNTGAEDSAALIASAAGLIGLGGMLMLARRRSGFQR